MYKSWFGIKKKTFNSWYAIKPNQTKTKPNQTKTTNVFGSFCNIIFRTKLDYVIRSSVCHEAMYHVSAQQLPWYYKPKGVLTKAWTALVTWCTHCKLAHTNILPNISLAWVKFYWRQTFHKVFSDRLWILVLFYFIFLFYFFFYTAKSTRFTK